MGHVHVGKRWEPAEIVSLIWEEGIVPARALACLPSLWSCRFPGMRWWQMGEAAQNIGASGALTAIANQPYLRLSSGHLAVTGL